MNDRSTLLLEHHLKELKLPSFLREYEKIAAQCASEGVDHPQYLLRLAELELIDRHQRMVERRIRAAMGFGADRRSAEVKRRYAEVLRIVNQHLPPEVPPIETWIIEQDAAPVQLRGI